MSTLPGSPRIPQWLPRFSIPVPRRASLALVAVPAALVGAALMAGSLASAGGVKPAPLDKAALPKPDLSAYVKAGPEAKTALGQLGKALFWDVQVGGDGNTACASCHYQAGADVRVTNQINPGKNNGFEHGLAQGATVKEKDFPLKIDSDDRMGSQGVFPRTFKSLGIDAEGAIIAADECTDAGSQEFRQTTGRNTPSAVNAVFNFHNFWDGRANNHFNGINPLGPGHEGTASIVKLVGDTLTPVPVDIPNSSAASQAVGPPNNGTEMSCAGRSFPQLGHKLLSLKPLGKQQVANDDSMLGPLTATGKAKGLRDDVSYEGLIKQAFQPEWWASPDALPDGSTQMEANFSLFWGLAVQEYESTLISDDSPFDRFARGKKDALTRQQQEGLNVFQGKGRCANCHGGPLFSNAGSAANNGFAGFKDIGVRPTAEDPGAGERAGLLQPDPTLEGFFKVPTLRNVELNGPYFHNGEAATLRQVVDFYSRGGDFHGATNPNVDKNIKPLKFSDREKDALVAFLMSLTDDRVRLQKAPFDHPELPLPNAVNPISATGAGGGAEVKPFLNLDPRKP